MLKDNILSFYKEQWSIFEGSLKDIKKTLNPDSVKQTRTSIKKIRVVLIAFNYFFDKRLEKKFKKDIRGLYKKLGGLRQKHIQTQLMKLYDKKIENNLDESSLVKKIESAIKKHEKRVLKKINKISTKRVGKISRKFKKGLKRLNNKEIDNTILKSLLLSSQFVEKAVNNDRFIHENRKNLKTFRYLLEICQNTEIVKDVTSFIKPVVGLESFTGAWNDNFEFQMYIMKYMSKLYNKAAEKKILTEISKLIEKEKEICMDNYFKSLKELIQSDSFVQFKKFITDLKQKE